MERARELLRRLRWARRRGGQLGPAAWWLLVHAHVAMVVARVLLAIVPVRKILDWQGHAVGEARLEDAEGVRQQIRWAVLVVARRSPVQLVCFPQCLAASYLLRRQGLRSRLHYGVTRDVGGALATHTWLESGGEVLIGGEVKEGYATLGVFGEGDGAVGK